MRLRARNLRLTPTYVLRRLGPTRTRDLVILLGILLLGALAVLFFVNTLSPPPRERSVLQYTALGDSITSGSGASKASNSWVQRYARYIDEDFHARTTVVNLAEPGAKSTKILSYIRTRTEDRSAIAHSRVITVGVGTNDFFYAKESYRQFPFGYCGGADNQDCLRSMVSLFDANMDAIVEEIQSLIETDAASIALLNVYYPDAALNQAEGSFYIFEPYLSQMNEHLRELAQSHGVQIADAHSEFNGADGTENPVQKGYIDPSVDTVHPTDAGHLAIANLFRLISQRVLPTASH